MNLSTFDDSLADLSDRVSALRQSWKSAGADSQSVLDALFVEFDLAWEELRICREELSNRSDRGSDAQRRGDQERRLLRSVFGQLPLPVFLLNPDGSVRRVNEQAAKLLGASATYLTGKPFLTFVALPSRATLRSHLSALRRGQGQARVTTRLSGPAGQPNVGLRLTQVDVAEEARPLICALAAPPQDGAAGDGWTGYTNGSHGSDHIDEELVRAATLRLQVMTQMTRLLLDADSLQEPVALGRSARLLVSELADWALIDTLDDGARLRRAVACGRDDDSDDSNANALEEVSPYSAPVFEEVCDDGNSQLCQSIADEWALGAMPDGLPVLSVLEAGSWISVPLRHGAELLGVLTVARRAGRTSFDIADLGLLEELGEHLGLALAMERKYRRRSDAAETLQASLLPRALPAIPGIDVTATYRAAAEGVKVGGDFYDVFQASEGFGFVLGDVCGKGEQAATVAAATRNWIQLLGLSEPQPAAVLAQVNHAMLTHQASDRFVTAICGRLWHETGLQGSRVRVRLATAGHPRAIVLRADGRVRFVGGGGLPLGLFTDAETASHDIELEPQDALLLYSDGVTENRDTNGEFYSDQRLADSLTRVAGLPASTILKEVEDDLQRHGLSHSRDDITMLALRVTDTSL